jgi:hypothetical protein
MQTTIPQPLRPYRRRAIEAIACVGIHAWNIGHWDGETDAEAYCLDAPDLIPAGSVRGFFPMHGHVAPRVALREQP